MKITDTDRLDFLVSKRTSCRGPYFCRTAPPQWRVRIYPTTYWGNTLREALDAAIRAAQLRSDRMRARAAALRGKR